MSNEKQTEAKEKVSNCVCLKCYKLKCKARNIDTKCCPEQSGPVDWKGRSINEQRKIDY